MQGDIKMSKLASCGGCGAKVGAGMLSQILQGIPTVKDENLLVGYDTSDDAAVYKVSDDLAIVQTLDFFPPIVDDPYMFGQIAAANAISDIYAMGATPKIALNIMTVTPQMSKEMIHEVLRGGYEKAYEAGVIIAVQSGTTGETYCRENFPNATIQPYGNSTDSFAAMQAGQATAVCTNAAVVKKMLSEAYSDAQVVLEVATGEEYAVAVNKDNPELTKAINEAIKKLQDDGTVEKLAAKWLG